MEIVTIPRKRGAQNTVIGNLSLVALRLAQFARSLMRWEPMFVSKYHDARIAEHVARLTTQNVFDIVQLEMTAMAQYLPNVRSGKSVLHEHDVAFRPAYRSFRHEASALKKFFMWIEWCRWSRFELNAGPRFDRVLCVTEQDTMLFRRLTGSNRVSYFPRGVEVAKSFPAFESRKNATLLFVGTYSHAPNVDAAMWLASEIFPLVLQKRPDAELRLIGKNPPDALRRMAERYRQIKVLGFVDDIGAELASASCFVAPLRFGGGVKIKLLHAIAAGIPAVTTRIGVEGIEGIDAQNVFIGDSAETLAAHVVASLADRARAASRAQSAWEAIRRHYSWEGTVKRLEEIYRETSTTR
jgi:glycosyltransferase involved in cell wall biosynthesis